MRYSFTALVSVMAVLLSEPVSCQTTVATVADCKITLMEIGSDRCIPCRQMQQVMSAVRSKYGRQVHTLFYDVRTKEGKAVAARYGVDAIPVQVFLDQQGRFFFCHEGYFPEEAVVMILKGKGVEENP